MKIKPFAVEEWMNRWETSAKYNVAETCVDSVSLDELFALTGEDRGAFFDQIGARRLTYGDITGAPDFKAGICALYETISPEEIIPTHGAAGANHHVFYSLIQPGDPVISLLPTYQQLYSIPESFGADMRLLRLQEGQGYLPDPAEIERLASGGAAMICLNNPNNPTGAFMPEDLLREIVEIARKAGAWLLCDETYRLLSQRDEPSPSVADLYEKGISVSSMSKVFSLAGLRLGWIATHDADAREAFLSHRDYNLISCGIFDEAVAALALRHADVLLGRSRSIVRENLALLDRWVAETPPVHYVKPRAGSTALVHYDLDLSSYDFCLELLQQTGAFVTPGDCFEQPRSFRIGYACDKQTLRDGLDAIASYLKSKQK